MAVPVGQVSTITWAEPVKTVHCQFCGSGVVAIVTDLGQYAVLDKEDRWEKYGKPVCARCVKDGKDG